MSTFAPIPESEQHAVAELLLATFNADAQALSFRSDVLRWKYFSPHPHWQGTRSYGVKHADQLVAHGGVWPLVLRTHARNVNAIHLVDGAANKGVPGSGILLVRKFAQMADVLLTIGGSSDTRTILPKLGYRRVNNLKYYARVVRPWRQFVTTPQHNWKAPLRLLRNTLWSLRSHRTPEAWKAVRISQFEDSQQNLLGNSCDKVLRAWRTTCGLNYMLSCPAAEFSAYLMLEDQKQRGYFIVAKLGGQARIVEIRLNAEDEQSWLAAAKLASHVAAQDPTTCEVVVATSEADIAAAFEQRGFRLRRSDPIYCYDPNGVLADASPLGLSMLDGDACFLTDPEHPYLT